MCGDNTLRPAIAYLRARLAPGGTGIVALQRQRDEVRLAAAARGYEIVHEEMVLVRSRDRMFRACRAFERALEMAKDRGIPIFVADMPKLIADHPGFQRYLKSEVAIASASRDLHGGAKAHTTWRRLRAIAAQRHGHRLRKAFGEQQAVGIRLGNPQSLEKARRTLARARAQLANSFAESLRAVLTSYGALVSPAESRPTLSQLAQRLNGDGHRTSKGRLWTPAAVRRVLIRLGES